MTRDSGAASGFPTECSRRSLGESGEHYVALMLERAGYRILDRNWRAGRREIDIVAQWGAEIVFVEVKTRRPGPQPPSETVTPAQRRRLLNAAAFWIHAHPGVGSRFRFDLIVLTVGADRRLDVRHFRNAFDANGP